MKLKYLAWGLLFAAGNLLAGDTYQIDPAHTTVGFSVEHLVISKVSGRFKDVTGMLEVDLEAKPVVRSATATVKAASIDTGIEKRDEHLRGADFFDVAQFPDLTFVSKKVAAKDGKNYITGTLTIHGVSREVTALFTIKGPVKDPWGKMRLGLHASGTIDRKDYGLTWSKTLETGGLVVGDEVELDLQVEAIKVEAEKK
jgi:polyisoprenoid-binding protein YceI